MLGLIHLTLTNQGQPLTVLVKPDFRGGGRRPCEEAQCVLDLALIQEDQPQILEGRRIVGVQPHRASKARFPLLPLAVIVEIGTQFKFRPAVILGHPQGVAPQRFVVLPGRNLEQVQAAQAASAAPAPTASQTLGRVCVAQCSGTPQASTRKIPIRGK